MRKNPNPLLWAMCVCILLATVGALRGMPATRTIEFDTRQVTQPDVALTPDGKSLIFTMLGHLFRLPVDGGSAEQLTFGPRDTLEDRGLMRGLEASVRARISKLLPDDS